VKPEKMMMLTENDFEAFRPRLIQALSWCAKAEAGPWFLNYSTAMKRAWNIDSTIWYCSGYTTDDYNRWFENALNSIEGRILYVWSDFSKYDITQRVLCMDRETQHYKDLGFDEAVRNGAEIRAAMHTSTVHAKSMRYCVPGTRKSGDSNTSSGNTKNTGEFVFSFFSRNGLGNDCRIAALGDDNFSLLSLDAVLERFGSVVSFKKAMESAAKDLGYKLKVGASTEVMSAEFLSSRFYPTCRGHRIGKKPGRVLSKIGWQVYKAGRKPEEYLRYFAGSLISYLPTSTHVPFLRVYIKVMLGHLEHLNPLHSSENVHRMKGEEAQADECTWAAFESHYGLNSEDEIQFEKALRRHIKEHGITSVMMSEHVKQLFTIDFQEF
jgi:hypothetical protein